MDIMGMMAMIMEATEAEVSLTPLFSKKKYTVIPVNPAKNSAGTSFLSSLEPGSIIFSINTSITDAIRNLARARVIGGITATDTFILKKDSPHSMAVKVMAEMGSSFDLFKCLILRRMIHLTILSELC